VDMARVHCFFCAFYFRILILHTFLYLFLPRHACSCISMPMARRRTTSKPPTQSPLRVVDRSWYLLILVSILMLVVPFLTLKIMHIYCFLRDFLIDSSGVAHGAKARPTAASRKRRGSILKLVLCVYFMRNPPKLSFHYILNY